MTKVDLSLIRLFWDWNIDSQLLLPVESQMTTVGKRTFVQLPLVTLSQLDLVAVINALTASHLDYCNKSQVRVPLKISQVAIDVKYSS